jgi:hypothetical protein
VRGLHHNQMLLLGVSEGTRTLDPLDHNQMLYQLSYTHHAGAMAEPGQSTWPSTMPRTAFAAARASSDVGPGGATNRVRR